MNKYLIITLFSFGLLTGCTEDINLKVTSGANKIVIEGSIENGKKAEVMVTRNSPLTSAVDFTKIVVMDAKVYVTSAGVTDTLKLGIDSSAAIPYLYIGSQLLGVPGQTYNLTVIADGQTFTSVTTIPSPVKLDSVWWKADPPHDTLGFAWAHLSEPAGPGNAYRWYAKLPRKSIMFNGAEILLNRRYVPCDGATFDDKFVDGKSFDFYGDRGYDPTEAAYTETLDKKQLGYYKPTDTIYVKFCAIDRAAYSFYSTYEAELGNNGNPFASPVSILSNINGGALGVWSGMGATYDTIYPHH